jgi:hypothetical protein
MHGRAFRVRVNRVVISTHRMHGRAFRVRVNSSDSNVCTPCAVSHAEHRLSSLAYLIAGNCHNQQSVVSPTYAGECASEQYCVPSRTQSTDCHRQLTAGADIKQSVMCPYRMCRRVSRVRVHTVCRLARRAQTVIVNYRRELPRLIIGGNCPQSAVSCEHPRASVPRACAHRVPSRTQSKGCHH